MRKLQKADIKTSLYLSVYEKQYLEKLNQITGVSRTSIPRYLISFVASDPNLIQQFLLYLNDESKIKIVIQQLNKLQNQEKEEMELLLKKFHANQMKLLENPIQGISKKNIKESL